MYPEYNKTINLADKELLSNFYSENLSKYTYLDYSNLEMPDDCFSDLVHLSFKGSILFTDYFTKTNNASYPEKIVKF
jgi:hypothetical protein